MNENDDEEFDWGEQERRARMFEHIAEVMERMRSKQYVPILLNKLTAGLSLRCADFQRRA